MPNLAKTFTCPFLPPGHPAAQNMWTKRPKCLLCCYSLWELNLGGGTVVSDSITDHGRRPTAPLAIERLQATGFSSKINPACWSSATEGETSETSGLENVALKGRKNLFKSHKIKFVFKEQKMKSLIWTVILGCLMSVEWKRCFPLLACCSDLNQTAPRLDELWTLLISSWLKGLLAGSFFVCLFFSFGSRKDSGPFVSRQG